MSRLDEDLLFLGGLTKESRPRDTLSDVLICNIIKIIPVKIGNTKKGASQYSSHEIQCSKPRLRVSQHRQ